MKASQNADAISIWDVNFAVVDVETTGHSPKDNRITEISCIIMRGGEVASEFTSLINPRQQIPPFIAQMTGITDAMVASAPEAIDALGEVMKIIAKPNTVFVAHNASFDYNFVNETLVRCGIEPLLIPQICTLKLARRLLPHSLKKNVGSVAEYFGINIENRHRAYGDAIATTQFFIEMLDIAQSEYEIETIDELIAFQSKRSKNYIPTQTIAKRLEPCLVQIPDEPGVYFFHDAQGKTLYIGKAKSLRESVSSYFRPTAQFSPKFENILRRAHQIVWESADTELSAILLESREINRLAPSPDSFSQRMRRSPFLRLDARGDFPALGWTHSPVEDGAIYYGPFHNRTIIQDLAETINNRFISLLSNNSVKINTEASRQLSQDSNNNGSPKSSCATREEYWALAEQARNFLDEYTLKTIKNLRREMTAASDLLKFERAASIRNRLREIERVFYCKECIPTSRNEQNVIIIIPASARVKTVEIFFIAQGRLINQQTIGRKAPLEGFAELLKSAYYQDAQTEQSRLSPAENEAIQLITLWINQNPNAASCIYPGLASCDMAIAEFCSAVRLAFTNTDD